VPAGFCITSAAFREHLEQNNLLGRPKSAADELAKTVPAPLETDAEVLNGLAVSAGVVRILQQ
jgi:phosphoenolpyruvate synthase/pyruvate phosphate dikinase